MCRTKKTGKILLSVFTLCLLVQSMAVGNGGPFVIKYPNGDPAAKGVLARLDPDLKPGRETRLRVIKEDLKVTFGGEIPFGRAGKSIDGPPLAHVSAEYTIENPTNEEVEVDFGFPILRGIYVDPHSMMPRPDVHVRLDKKVIKSTVISNSAIYGIIRQRAREVIENAIADDIKLKELVDSVRNANNETLKKERKALLSHLVDNMNWNYHYAALMVEYTSLDFGKFKVRPPDRNPMGLWGINIEFHKLINENLGPVAAIGEQKATQFFALLASRFKPEAAAAYEAIFTAWGGDVRERSVDLKTGKVRPREITVDYTTLAIKPSPFTGSFDPTIYARVDYLDPKAKISESEKASCKAILKNLPVVFTFAPMNILHYQVKFPAKSTQTLTVSYSQYAYWDTHSPSSYQLAYVLHPASLWDEFGPINLEVAVPEGIDFRASVPCENSGAEQRRISQHGPRKRKFNIYKTVLKQKTGELYLAVEANGWKKNKTQVALISVISGARRAAQQSAK
ncbi:MAG: hypothetical protein GWN67_24570 [Phycisphaerae bacterium]|nr:hypothetical protein [Phycisphaerae bacterium]NIP53231.1 hypothetical protein [Phycisphaerae bacterium]NIS52257.1 hypothetical protein [Phycisphaerae bacterium]NIU09803.1 hypothetical protein [Phycisphaerae bacterium]NIU59441.1 hypothetical protein [Phycisphaerae bacterium]